MTRLLLALALLAASADALLMPFAARSVRIEPRAAVSMGVEEVAAACLEEGCPIDLVDDLIAELKGERAPSPVHAPHLARIHRRAEGSRVASQRPVT